MRVFKALLNAAAILMVSESIAASLKEIEISRIEVTGVTVFESAVIESSLEIGVGDKVERPRVVRSAHNIEELYRVRGYEEVRVRSELVRAKSETGVYEPVLRFSVNEGKPARIGEIQFTSVSQDKSGSLPARLLAEKLNVKIGDVFDQEKIVSGKQAVQDALASEEYVGVRVSEVRVRTLGADAVPKGEYGPTSRWVGVELKIDLGDRVSFGFRGNSNVSRSRLIELVEEQRALGFGRDYVSEIRSRIEDEYRSLGYAAIKVRPYTFERKGDRQVSYEIEEGPRVEIHGVRFDGNRVFTSEELRRVFFDRATPLTKRSYFSETDAERSAELLIEWMKSQGYLAAKLVTVSKTYVQPKREQIKLVIYLYEGDQTIVREVNISGVTAFDGAEIRELLGVREDSPLDLFAFGEGLERLKSAYREKGYLEVKLSDESSSSLIRYSQENREASINMEVIEGYQYRVSGIDVDGLVGTREHVVRRELEVKEGEVLEAHLLGDSEARLRRLGIFSIVTVRHVDDPERFGYKRVKVSVQEGTPGIIGGGVGLRNDIGMRAFGQVGYTNLWHKNHTLAFNANVNRRFDESFCTTPRERIETPDDFHCSLEYQLQLSYVWPWFALGQTTFRPRVTFDRTQYQNFDASTLSFATTWERRLFKSVPLISTITYSQERVQQFNATDDVDNANLTIGAITPGLRLDLRDNSLAPTTGWFASGSLEFASTALGSQSVPIPVGYTRFQARLDRYIPLGTGITWFLSFRTGFERNLEPPPADDPDNKRYAIPLIKQFALGGAASLRGFKEQELNLQNIAIRGTASYVNYRTQIDLPFAGALRIGPFLDAANLKIDSFSFGNLRFGSGVGLHYQSPVGPVNFDFGFKLDPRPNEDTSRFYFSIGVL